MVWEQNLAGAMALQRDKVMRNLGSAAMVTRFMTTGVLVGCLLTNITCAHKPSGEQSLETAMPDALPKEFRQELDRFTFINTATGETLKEFRVLGGAAGTYVREGAIYDTYVVSFEDRYGGADADLDFIDVIVEMKRARESDTTTVRIVQLGLDTIDVYMDGRFLDSVRPAIEVQITSRSD